jgi:hypothetical protein
VETRLQKRLQEQLSAGDLPAVPIITDRVSDDEADKEGKAVEYSLVTRRKGQPKTTKAPKNDSSVPSYNRKEIRNLARPATFPWYDGQGDPFVVAFWYFNSSTSGAYCHATIMEEGEFVHRTVLKRHFQERHWKSFKERFQQHHSKKGVYVIPSKDAATMWYHHRSSSLSQPSLPSCD